VRIGVISLSFQKVGDFFRAVPVAFVIALLTIVELMVPVAVAWAHKYLTNASSNSAAKSALSLFFCAKNAE
jgi:hypothetical protein